MSDSRHFYRSQLAVTRSEIWRNQNSRRELFSCLLKIGLLSRSEEQPKNAASISATRPLHAFSAEQPPPTPERKLRPSPSSLREEWLRGLPFCVEIRSDENVAEPSLQVGGKVRQMTPSSGQSNILRG